MTNLYLLINLFSVLVPFLFSFHPRLAFQRKWRFAFPAIIISSFIFVLWDIYFTHIGVWGFNSQYLRGIYIANLPLEEVLFFICIPYSCLFTYHCFSILVHRQWFARSERWITASLIILMLVTAILYKERLYTSVTFTALATLLILLKYIFKVKWLNRFYFTYSVLLIPFCIVNGVLTGTGLKEPVVWYNNHQNLAIRLGTIPVEDVFYGMLLILLNISLYEYFKSRDKQ